MHGLTLLTLPNRFSGLQRQRSRLQLNPNSIGQLNYADRINLPHRSKRETMNARNFNRLVTGVAVVAAWMLVPSALAQRGRGPQGPQVVSPEVSADRRITFRILAARAQTVRLNGGDIPANSQGSGMTTGTNGVW